ncbi:MAG TPA: cyclase family protein [Flavobacteriales bacterium]|nr:cyclase family protein [Flavobacteriales bacterium]HMW97183.1 cyclase family protein [Flavobacteriales bacterium]HMZ48207.1 cyclase family protein [Flavobacteriales bacterium]HNE79997.1 cyclase family protein [Flavobacteriales bacterium]HNI03470.1 cyclase family protein [Flavobacteriales bacterium]
MRTTSAISTRRGRTLNGPILHAFFLPFMIADISHKGQRYRIALNDPIDLSLPLDPDAPGPLAWYAGAPRMEPVRDGAMVYAVAHGAAVNFRDVHFNPHAHGTHTEGVGHITHAVHPVGDVLTRYFFTAQLLSVSPEVQRYKDGLTDQVITLQQLQAGLGGTRPEALVLRTLPNDYTKRTRIWSGQNPAYIEGVAAAWLRTIGIRHLLIDTPSVDRESDDGVLSAHHAFWDHPANTDLERTITEMIFVPNEVHDGDYLLELQLPRFMNDAAPSRPVLYALLPHE